MFVNDLFTFNKLIKKSNKCPPPFIKSLDESFCSILILKSKMAYRQTSVFTYLGNCLAQY